MHRKWDQENAELGRVTVANGPQAARCTSALRIIITGPNENSRKASKSVNVLAANSQDEVYEGTTRPRPEKRQANTKTRRRDE